MHSIFTTELNPSLKQLSSPRYQDATSTAFVWYFYINVPDGTPEKRTRKQKNLQIEGDMLTPVQNSLDGPSLKSLTPLSFIDKIANFSPFHTASQKRPNTSKDNSHQTHMNLKRTKHITRTSQETLAALNNKRADQPIASVEKLAPNTELFGSQSETPEKPNIVKNTSKQLNGENLFKPILSRTATVDLPLTYIESAMTVGRDKNMAEGCNCRNTKCLKLYCECLRRGGVCGSSCNCIGCENHAHSTIRPEHVKNIERRNPLAFKQIGCIDQMLNSIPSKGCNCRRSHCLKNYCECHQFGAKCTDACRCIECKNVLVPALAPDNPATASHAKIQSITPGEEPLQVTTLFTESDS